jgi:hypothetical protein
MVTTQEKVIDGMHFAITQLPGMKGLRMSQRLGRILGPALAKGLSGMGSVSLDRLTESAVNMETIGEAVAILFDRLSENELEAITRELFASATVDGKPLMAAFDLVMQGKTLTVYKALLFAFEVNFGSFFDELRGLAVKQLAGRKSALRSPNVSVTTGPSGD